MVHEVHGNRGPLFAIRTRHKIFLLSVHSKRRVVHDLIQLHKVLRHVSPRLVATRATVVVFAIRRETNFMHGMTTRETHDGLLTGVHVTRAHGAGGLQRTLHALMLPKHINAQTRLATETMEKILGIAHATESTRFAMENRLGLAVVVQLADVTMIGSEGFQTFGANIVVSSAFLNRTDVTASHALHTVDLEAVYRMRRRFVVAKPANKKFIATRCGQGHVGGVMFASQQAFVVLAKRRRKRGTGGGCSL